MNKQQLFNLFFKEKNYTELKNILNDTQDNTEKYYLARVFLEEKNYNEAAKLFKSLDLRYEYGRCKLLCGSVEEASQIWKSIEDDTPATLWGKSLLEFINLYVINIPTFFQIRAFLEVDLDAVLKAGLITYAENIANGAHLFARNNQESYKFIGRVFVNNNYHDLAELFLNKAKDICYIDPEVHFMLAKCYLKNNNVKKAKEALEVSIDKGFGYFPAKRLLNKLNRL